MASSSISSSRRRFFLKLGAFLLLIVVLDAGIGSLLRHFYFTQKSGLNFRATYAVEQSEDDIIVLGSSRAQAHYVPSVLEEGLAGSCYNAGRNGQSLLYAAAVHSAVVARHAPRIVVLDLIPSDFFQNHSHYDRLAALLPYYRGNEAVRPFVRLRSRFESVKALSRIYPFNSLILQIMKYNFVEERRDKGFVPQIGQISLPLLPPKGRSWLRNGIDPEMIETFRSLVASCIANDIQLVLVISPVFDGQVFGPEAIPQIETILAGTPYSLWNYSNDPDFVREPGLFSDRDHLNKTGAMKYTEKVVTRIRLESGS